MQNERYRVEELAEASGVSIRNIRYYTAEGLLPPPDARGRYALYGEEHLRRLQFIQRLKESYFPLPVIKERLGELTGAEIGDLLEEGPEEAPLPAPSAPPTAPPLLGAGGPNDSAVNYIRRVLGNQRAAAPPSPETPPAAARSMMSPPSIRAAAVSQEPPAETWQRITLAPGVELHVRTVNDFVRQLIAYARTLGRSDS